MSTHPIRLYTPDIVFDVTSSHGQELATITTLGGQSFSQHVSHTYYREVRDSDDPSDVVRAYEWVSGVPDSEAIVEAKVCIRESRPTHDHAWCESRTQSPIRVLSQTRFGIGYHSYTSGPDHYVTPDIQHLISGEFVRVPSIIDGKRLCYTEFHYTETPYARIVCDSEVIGEPRISYDTVGVDSTFAMTIQGAESELESLVTSAMRIAKIMNIPVGFILRHVTKAVSYFWQDCLLVLWSRDRLMLPLRLSYPPAMTTLGGLHLPTPIATTPAGKLVVTIDLTSAYPTIIASHRIGIVPTDTLARVITGMLRIRADGGHTIVKRLMNSLYGLFGSRDFRFYWPNAASAITRIARELLTGVAADIQENRGEVVGGFTDSIRVLIPETTNPARDARELAEFASERARRFFPRAPYASFKVEQIARRVIVTSLNTMYMLLMDGSVKSKGIKTTPAVVECARLAMMVTCETGRDASIERAIRDIVIALDSPLENPFTSLCNASITVAFALRGIVDCRPKTEARVHAIRPIGEGEVDPMDSYDAMWLAPI